MLILNHQDVRHAWEMSRTNGPQRANYERILRQYLDQMRAKISKGQTVIITKTTPANPNSISLQEMALVIRTSEELGFYQDMLGQMPDALSNAMLQAKLQKARKEDVA